MDALERFLFGLRMRDRLSSFATTILGCTQRQYYVSAICKMSFSLTLHRDPALRWSIIIQFTPCNPKYNILFIQLNNHRPVEFNIKYRQLWIPNSLVFTINRCEHHPVPTIKKLQTCRIVNPEFACFYYTSQSLRALMTSIKTSKSSNRFSQSGYPMYTARSAVYGIGGVFVVSKYTRFRTSNISRVCRFVYLRRVWPIRPQIVRWQLSAMSSRCCVCVQTQRCMR